jgi:hypothetical protein
MAWATVERVKEVGGLNHPHDYLAYRLDGELDLDNLIDKAIRTASAWIKTRIAGGIYTTLDLDVQELLALGESYLTLHFMTPALKARKVYGTHFAFESEDSDRYAELIDMEWMALAQELLGEWLTVPVGEAHFAFPRLLVGTPIPRNVWPLDSVEQEWLEELDRVRSLPVNLP